MYLREKQARNKPLRHHKKAAAERGEDPQKAKHSNRQNNTAPKATPCKPTATSKSTKSPTAHKGVNASTNAQAIEGATPLELKENDCALIPQSFPQSIWLLLNCFFFHCGTVAGQRMPAQYRYYHHWKSKQNRRGALFAWHGDFQLSLYEAPIISMC